MFSFEGAQFPGGDHLAKSRVEVRSLPRSPGSPPLDCGIRAPARRSPAKGCESSRALPRFVKRAPPQRGITMACRAECIRFLRWVISMYIKADGSHSRLLSRFKETGSRRATRQLRLRARGGRHRMRQRFKHRWWRAS
jgi:hypothetical protein